MDVTTPILTKWKEKWPEYILGAICALLVLLFSIIWLAIPSEAWVRISASIPTRVLWATLGLTAVVICLLAAYVFHLRREATRLLSEIENLKTAPKPKRPKFGVLWDENLEPYCPVHTEVHLNNWLELPRHTGYMCPVGGHMVPLRDDEGEFLTPKQAKAMLSDTINATSNKSFDRTAR